MIAMYFISPPSRVLPGGALRTTQSGRRPPGWAVPTGSRSRAALLDIGPPYVPSLPALKNLIELSDVPFVFLTSLR
jgi:hypothetical protein